MSPLLTILCVSPLLLPSISSAPSSEYVLRNVFHDKDKCYKDSFVYVQNIDDRKFPNGKSPFLTYSTTKECSTRLKQEEYLPEKLPDCPQGLIDFVVNPVYVPRSQISYPFANLNISVTAHSSVDTILFRLQCLSTSDGSDVYCSDSKAMYIDGVKEWPCRAIQLSSEVKYPARFSYSCFRLTSHSVYAVNVTILPQMCRSSTILTAPTFDDMFPDVLVDPQDEADLSSDPYWAPMISVDLSDPSGIWIRLGKPPNGHCKTMHVNIYREHLNDSQKVSFVEKLDIQCPEEAVKWVNQMAGMYLITAYVPIRGCQFHCESSEKSCQQCLRTHLNLRIDEDRASFVWLATQKLKDVSYELFVGSLVAVCVLSAVMLSFVAYGQYRRWKDAKRVREIQLSEYVKTMIVYADDNEPHTNCVKMLVDNLRHCATCYPVFDLEELITAEQVIPSRWLIDQVSSLSKFVIVMSPCAEKLLDTQASQTHYLEQARPFDDLFRPALEMIIRDATHHSSESRKKYAIVRFAYSPPVPANLAALGFPVFELPAKFANLTAFLHNLDDVEGCNISQNIPEQRCLEWKCMVDREMEYVESNPNWMDGRWKRKEDRKVPQLVLKPPVHHRIETDEDRIAASKRFNLEPPGEDSDEENGPTDENSFMLYPPGQPDSEEEEDVEEEKNPK